jgi:tRNA-dihydrouridine synthase
MVTETGCDAVMIGRAAATNPWIFRQIEQFHRAGEYEHPTEADRYRLLSGYFNALVESRDPESIGKMKQFACWFTHGVRNGNELRRGVHASRTPAEVLVRVDEFFSDAAASDPVSDPALFSGHAVERPA